MFGDDEPKRPAGITVGEPLDSFSEEELADRIAVLHVEIKRIEEVLKSKRAVRDAASAFFKS